MFTQFRVRYPKGSLVTELVTIEHGKYIVRCLIQVEGTTLVTGLAAAETVELAEDKARSRALAVLDMDTTTATGENDTPLARRAVPEVLETTSKVPTAFSEAPSRELLSLDATPSGFAQATLDSDATDVLIENLEQPQSPLFPDISAVGSTNDFSFSDSTSKLEPAAEVAVTALRETDEIPFTDELPSSEMETVQEIDISAVKGKKKPKAQRDETPTQSYSQSEQETVQSKASTITTTIDFSELIARTNVELKRLGWTNQQGRDYLLQTYGKRSRQLLSDDELLDFLHHLESEPTPE